MLSKLTSSGSFRIFKKTAITTSYRLFSVKNNSTNPSSVPNSQKPVEWSYRPNFKLNFDENGNALIFKCVVHPKPGFMASIFIGVGLSTSMLLLSYWAHSWLGFGLSGILFAAVMMMYYNHKLIGSRVIRSILIDKTGKGFYYTNQVQRKIFRVEPETYDKNKFEVHMDKDKASAMSFVDFNKKFHLFLNQPKVYLNNYELLEAILSGKTIQIE